MRKTLVLLAIGFFIGYLIGSYNTSSRIVYRTEYVKDPDSVPRATLNSELEKARTAAFAEGQRIGTDEGFRSGYVQGTEYGQSVILDQIDLRVQEAERTNKNIPLFKVKRN